MWNGCVHKERQREKLGELFAIGLYAITLPLLISLLFQAVGINIPHVESLALLAFMLAVVFTRSAVPQPKDAATPDNTHNNS